MFFGLSFKQLLGKDKALEAGIKLEGFASNTQGNAASKRMKVSSIATSKVVLLPGLSLSNSSFPNLNLRLSLFAIELFFAELFKIEKPSKLLIHHGHYFVP
jgi:hypothetical protein